MTALRFKWKAPDGKAGRWQKTSEGAKKSAVAQLYSNPSEGLRVSFCSRSAEILWSSLESGGWTIVKEGKAK